MLDFYDLCLHYTIKSIAETWVFPVFMSRHLGFLTSACTLAQWLTVAENIFKFVSGRCRGRCFTPKSRQIQESEADYEFVAKAFDTLGPMNKDEVILCWNQAVIVSNGWPPRNQLPFSIQGFSVTLQRCNNIAFRDSFEDVFVESLAEVQRNICGSLGSNLWISRERICLRQKINITRAFISSG